jgi:serine/threonine protein kinase
MFQEITLNNELDHPSFIKLHAVYEGDNTFYMVMDLLEGRSLHQELQNHKSGFPLDIVKTIMIVNHILLYYMKANLQWLIIHAYQEYHASRLKTRKHHDVEKRGPQLSQNCGFRISHPL